MIIVQTPLPVNPWTALAAAKVKVVALVAAEAALAAAEAAWTASPKAWTSQRPSKWM